MAGPLERAISVLLIIVGIVFFPVDALAWGPVAHVDFSLQLLAGAAALAPVIRSLINRRHTDFLYGNLAADAVVAKNMARVEEHCHSWSVGLRLLEDSVRQGEERSAFVLGYLSHLAADVVAHNLFVPARLVSCYRLRQKGHLYWEMRFDAKLLALDPTLDTVWRELSRMRFPQHDRFLAERLEPTLFPHVVSRSLYHRSLVIQSQAPWKRAFARIDERSVFPLTEVDVELWRSMSIAYMSWALNEPRSSALFMHDPTGRESLEHARHRRAALRRMARRSFAPVAWDVVEEDEGTPQAAAS